MKKNWSLMLVGFLLLAMDAYTFITVRNMMILANSAANGWVYLVFSALFFYLGGAVLMLILLCAGLWTMWMGWEGVEW